MINFKLKVLIEEIVWYCIENDNTEQVKGLIEESICDISPGVEKEICEAFDNYGVINIVWWGH